MRILVPQVVNHFPHTTCITTKVGLCHAIRELPWQEEADQRTFYPRWAILASTCHPVHNMVPTGTACASLAQLTKVLCQEAPAAALSCPCQFIMMIITVFQDA
jgi:hypothetical protein